MNTISSEEKIKFYPGLITWSILIAIIWYLNICSPPITDDWWYNCMEWKNVLPDTYREYFTWNPRLTGTFLTRVFSLSPNWLVDILNTLGVLLLFGLILYTSFGSRWKSVALQWYTPLLLWGLLLFVMINPGQVILWHCGVAFYVWPMVTGMTILASLMQSLREETEWNPSWWIVVGLGILTAISSLGTYNFTGAVFLLACAMLVRNQKLAKAEKIWMLTPGSKKLVFILLVIAVCLLFILIAPGNAVRMKSHAPEEIGNIFNGGFERQNRDFVSNVFNIHIVRFLWVYALIICGYIVRRFIGNWTREDALVIYICTALFFVSLGSFYMSPVQVAPRVYAPSSLFLIIAAFKILYPLAKFKWRLVRYIFTISILAWMLMIIPVFKGAEEQRIWWKRAQTMLASDKTDIQLPYYPSMNNYMATYPMFVEDVHQETGKNHVSRVCGKNSVRENRVRCRYETSDKRILTILDMEEHGTSGVMQCTHESEIIVWYPSPSRMAWLNPSSVWNRLKSDSIQQTNASHLKEMGYVSATLKQGKIEWPTYPKSLKKPAIPTIWVQTSPETDLYERCPAKPDWR